MVQWLRLCASNAGGAGSIPGQGTRSHMPQLSLKPTTKDPTCHIPSVITKTWHSQIYIYIFFFFFLSVSKVKKKKKDSHLRDKLVPET